MEKGWKVALEVFLLQGKKKNTVSREYGPPSLPEEWHIRTPHFSVLTTRLHFFPVEKARQTKPAVEIYPTRSCCLLII